MRIMKDNGVEFASDSFFKNRWAGEKGLVIGRGPSPKYEKNIVLNKFKGRKIGCNTAFNACDCDAIIFMDEMVFQKNKDQYQKLVKEGLLLFGVNIIYPVYGVKLYNLEARKPERCSESFDQGFYPCNLSGFVALNVALLMGLNPIYLFGFNPEKSQLKDRDRVIERSLKFQLIDEWCQKNNRKIYCTDKDSLLTMFFPYKSLSLSKTK